MILSLTGNKTVLLFHSTDVVHQLGVEILEHETLIVKHDKQTVMISTREGKLFIEEIGENDEDNTNKNNID